MHVARVLVGGDTQSREVDQLLSCCRSARLQRHDGAHLFAEPRIGHADDRDLGDGRVLIQHFLDFPGIDVVAAANNDILLPVDDVVVAIGIASSQISGAEPAVGDRGGGRRPELRAKLTPDYEIGCKRLLISSDYYPALTKPHVNLVTVGIEEVRTHSVLATDGTEYGADVLIFGTGFDAQNSLTRVPIRGRGGIPLGAQWASGPEAYMGTTVS